MTYEEAVAIVENTWDTVGTHEAASALRVIARRCIEVIAVSEQDSRAVNAALEGDDA